MKVFILISVVLACAATSQSSPTDTPNNTPTPRKLHIFDNIKAASSNLASAASNQISNGVNRTTNLVNTMSDVLTLALNTTNKLSTIDRKYFLGGKLANASSIFLNTTSTVVVNILNAKFSRLNRLIAIKTNITNKMLHISMNFVNKTGQLLTRLTATSRPRSLPSRKWNITQKILNKSINLANVTGQSLANVINATSVLLTKSIDDQTHFVTELLNSTANILNETTNSLGSLLNTTNHLIVDVADSKVDTSALVLYQTANLLSASSKTVRLFLNTTTLLINNAASNKLTESGHNFTLGGLNVTHNALKAVFRSTASLLQDVISAKKDISARLIIATGAFLDASIQIKTKLFNKSLDATKRLTNSTIIHIASKLHATADKLTSHLGDSTVPVAPNNKPLADGGIGIATENNGAQTEHTEISTENNEIQTEHAEVSTEKHEMTTGNGEASGDIETSSAPVNDDPGLSESLEDEIASKLHATTDELTHLSDSTAPIASSNNAEISTVTENNGAQTESTEISTENAEASTEPDEIPAENSETSGDIGTSSASVDDDDQTSSKAFENEIADNVTPSESLNLSAPTGAIADQTSETTGNQTESISTKSDTPPVDA
ncbi:uncharacterized protein LOC129569303 [Sitodiplosis mosellana]|uniref:uncharacterized protein LOC129569303 n=1 Tax=Sitodiplosis mosellana TaxID=263140 RepID=UPI0024442974|nr:uncharacterized protein LOC129569303 [Sitodiplosis mosellana]